MKTEITEDQIVDLIVSSTFIRGIDLENYKTHFQDAASHIKILIEREAVTYYSDSKKENITLVP